MINIVTLNLRTPQENAWRRIEAVKWKQLFVVRYKRRVFENVSVIATRADISVICVSNVCSGSY